ncbi:DUF397 domain-containing protein [Actinoplanes subtropicus]|uniref:DUF397 domain-containing protein n=1 Tax=Actinoplanes subtropicus TaxID=543632 RepID=UPI000A9552D6|nr:DUF397 domain-containing protein [Actinoplanes subtropicus]
MHTMEDVPLSGLDWQKSSYCGNTTCVEVAFSPAFVAIRDSKNVEQPALILSYQEWAALKAGINAGEFDLLNQ